MIHETSPPQKNIAIFHHNPNIHELLMGHFRDEHLSPKDIPFSLHRYDGKVGIKKFFDEEQPSVAIFGIPPYDLDALDIVEELQNTINTKIIITTTIPEKLFVGRDIKKFKFYREPFDLNILDRNVKEIVDEKEREIRIRAEKDAL